MFELPTIRETRSWQEAFEEGRQDGLRELGEEGRREGREEVRRGVSLKLLAIGIPTKDIAALLDISVQEVRRLSKNERR